MLIGPGVGLDLRGRPLRLVFDSQRGGVAVATCTQVFHFLEPFDLTPVAKTNDKQPPTSAEAAWPLVLLRTPLREVYRPAVILPWIFLAPNATLKL